MCPEFEANLILARCDSSHFHNLSRRAESRSLGQETIKGVVILDSSLI
jgi:hypothetical protein